MRAAFFFCLVSSLAFGCGTDGERGRAERPLADHGERPDPASDPLGAQLHEWGKEALPRMTPEPMVMRGELSRGQVQEHAVVLLGTHCYTFLGVAGADVRELDLLLVNPNGSVVFQDVDEGRRATLGLHEQICPDAAAQFEVRVRVFEGEGEYAVKVYGYQVI
ncbi:MAG: hypothetical protein H6721_08830 [Sandaracinus sp.]|nr:hypothetical protein [Sandaracinus sp.]MCB9632221.1 hypothetical protein [Sandaracinus sp.]